MSQMHSGRNVSRAGGLVWGLVWVGLACPSFKRVLSVCVETPPKRYIDQVLQHGVGLGLVLLGLRLVLLGFLSKRNVLLNVNVVSTCCLTSPSGYNDKVLQHGLGLGLLRGWFCLVCCWFCLFLNFASTVLGELEGRLA